MNFRVIQHQSYKKNDDLRVVHKAHGFTIGTFDKTGQFDVLNWETNGQLDLQFWNSVHFDPWTNSMFHKLFIADENARQTRVDYTANATQFFFRFKDDSAEVIRAASLDIVNIPGFKNGAVVFMYDGKLRPIAHEADSRLSASKDVITFDIVYRYDERKLWIDSQGVVQLGLTENEF